MKILFIILCFCFLGGCIFSATNRPLEFIEIMSEHCNLDSFSYEHNRKRTNIKCGKNNGY